MEDSVASVLETAPLRVGVVGIGFGQAVLVPAFLSHPKCQVVAIAASDVGRAARIADRLGIRVSYGDWRNLAEAADVDLVAIAVPPSLQPAVASAAAAAGKHVLCEKPVATSHTEAVALVAVLERQGVRHALDFEFFDLPEWREAEARIRSGELGVVQHLRVEWKLRAGTIRSGRAGWKSLDREGGGAIGGFASHALYHADVLLGPASLTGVDTTVREGGTTACRIALRTASGATADIDVDIDSDGPPCHIIEVRCLHGVVNLNTNQLMERRLEAVTHLVGRFLTAIRTGKPMRPDVTDGARIQRLLDAVQLPS